MFHKLQGYSLIVRMVDVGGRPCESPDGVWRQDLVVCGRGGGHLMMVMISIDEDISDP